MLWSTSDWLVVVFSILFLFVISHINVDKEFPQGQKIGATVVMSLVALVYLVFGVLI